MQEEKGKKAKGFSKPPRNSTVYDSESYKLYRFYEDRIMLIRFKDPYPAAYKKTTSNPYWVNYIPEAHFPFLFSKPTTRDLKHKKKKARNYYQYHNKILKKIIDSIGQDNFKRIDKFPSRQFFIMSLLFNGGKYAAKFIDQNPALSFLLSSHAIFKQLKSKKYWRSCRSLIEKKRKDILGYFGFPNSKEMVNVFSRMDSTSFDLDAFFWLRKASTEDPELVHRFLFFSKIKKIVIYFLCSDFSNLISNKYLEEIIKIKSVRKAWGYFNDVKDIYFMRKKIIDSGLDCFDVNLDAVEETFGVHNLLIERTNEILKFKNHIYPQSLLQDVKKGNVWIEQITDSAELKKEGNEMNHCIFSYDEHLQYGKLYAARMKKPERVTILFKDNGIECKLLDARCKFNKHPHPQTLKLIKKWLAGQVLFIDERYQLKLFEKMEMTQ